MEYNSGNIGINNNIHVITKPKFENSTWIAFDLEWQSTSISYIKNTPFSNNYANTKSKDNTSGASGTPIQNSYNKIITFGFEDSSGIQGCFDISNFNSTKSCLLAIIEKLLQYNYCFAWGSKSIKRKNEQSGKLEGINSDLVTLDSNFKANGLSSIIKYDKFSKVPHIDKFNQYSKQGFISDIDLLLVFAKPIIKNILYKNKYKSLHLDEVSKALLGNGKMNNKSGAKIDEMTISDRKSYCLHDAHLVAELIRLDDSKNLKIMDAISYHTNLRFDHVCHKGMTGIWKKILDDVIYKKTSVIGYSNLSPVLRNLFSSKILSGQDDEEYEDDKLEDYKENSYEEYTEILDQRLKDKDQKINNGSEHSKYSNNYKEKYEDSNINILNQKNKKYKGGSVLSPKQGLHYDVYVFDVTSLYPTIIINYNISPETINCTCCKFNIKARAVFDQNLLKDCLHIPKNDNCYWICQHKKGLFSKLLQELTEARIAYKKEGKEVESFAIKSIINSGYGVFGYSNFKYYDPKVAELITVLGRQILSEMQKIAGEIDLAILYGDTDSLFVNNVKRKEDIYKFIEECKTRLNIEVNHEKTFQKLILVAKKHYIGILNDPNKEPIIKGMEGIKSDRPKFIQEAFREMINNIKKDINPIPKLKQSINELECRRVSADKLAISVVLTKNPLEYTNDCLQKRLGIKKGLQKGDTIIYYKCDEEETETDYSGKTIIKKINESDNPNDISYTKYKEMLINSVKEVIEILGYNVEHDLTSKRKLAGSYLSIVTNTN